MFPKFVIFLFLFIGNSVLVSYGQPTYKTVEGHIVMIGEIDGQQVLAESHQLYIQLDYKTKEVSGQLNLKSADTGIEYLNKLIKEVEEPLSVSFSGVIPVEDFISIPHQPIMFEWPVTITIGATSFDVTLSALLTHFNGGETYACMLSVSGDISSVQTGIINKIPGLGDFIKIQLTQVILRRYG